MAVLPRIKPDFRLDQTVSLRFAAGATTCSALLFAGAVLSIPVRAQENTESAMKEALSLSHH